MSTRYLVSSYEMRELDHRAITLLGVPARVLMEVAGRRVADVAHARLGRPSHVVVVAGTGNNGGDGFVTARALATLGHTVRIFVIGDAEKIRGEALEALTTVKQEGTCAVVHVLAAADMVDLKLALDGADLVVDAMLGTGFSGDVRGLVADAIDLINDAKKPVVAVDLPSGIDADTGRIGGRAIIASDTVTFAFAKRGHYLFPGAELTGTLTVADIGIPESFAQKLGVIARATSYEDIPALLKKRSQDVHKGSFGSLAVFAGSPTMPGAAVLVMNAALRSGVGLVRWLTDDALLARARHLRPEAMLVLRHDSDNSEALVGRLLADASAVVAGPGLSQDPARAREIEALLATAQVPVCLDADGLNVLAQNPAWWALPRAPLVVTPHPKEMGRLLGRSVAEIQRDRVAAALELALARRCYVVLKGAGTVIAEPDGTLFIARAGNPGLAKGGTGDVLAGLIGGLLAQGLDPGVAARLGVLVHGQAGDLAAAAQGHAGLVASDVIESIGAVWATHGR